MDFCLVHAANLPPTSQWSFDYVSNAWNSENDPFSSADFTNVLLTPSNFEQWQAPNINYFGDSVYSPLSATTEIFDWCNQQEDSLVLYIYENWPDMGGYLSNGFPPTAQEWQNYLAYQNGDFHDWFLEYHDSLMLEYPDQCVRMIPVGPAINNLLSESPFDQIPITELYEDDAPHGRASIYFLAALTTYMAMYGEQPPATYMVDGIIHPIIANNYNQAVQYIWDVLLTFDNATNENRVFCSPPLTVDVSEDASSKGFYLYPKPIRWRDTS